MAIYKDAVRELQEICTIPHPSNQTPPTRFDETDDNLFHIRNYLIDKIDQYIGKDAAHTDDAHNVFFDIPASKGAENFKGIALQAHMDMVWAASGEATSWDPKTHPVSEPVIEEVDGKMVMHTDGWLTSLGADDGQGMAMILSLAKNRKKFKHGLIRCVVTADEETSGRGADNLGIINEEKTDFFRNVSYLINLDLPHGGKVAETAAGIHAYVLDVVPELETEKSNDTLYQLSFTDFLGGHSGEEIDLGRQNPLKLIARVVQYLIDKGHVVRLSSFNTDNIAMNKIPEKAQITFTCADDRDIISSLISEQLSQIEAELKWRGTEKNAKMKLEILSGSQTTVLKNNDQSHAIINFVNKIPFGPYERFEDDWFIGSSANIAPFNWTLTTENKVKITTNVSLRYGHAAWFDELKTMVDEAKASLQAAVGEVQLNEAVYYPVWEMSDNKKLRDLVMDSYIKNDVKSEAMKSHGGLEAAHIVTDYPDLVAIAIGATDLNEHMTTEQLVLEEYETLAKVMLRTLQNMNI